MLRSLRGSKIVTKVTKEGFSFESQNKLMLQHKAMHKTEGPFNRCCIWFKAAI